MSLKCDFILLMKRAFRDDFFSNFRGSAAPSGLWPPTDAEKDVLRPSPMDDDESLLAFGKEHKTRNVYLEKEDSLC